MTNLLGIQSQLPTDRFVARDRGRAGALMSFNQLRWFIRLRWAMVALALAVLALERFVTPEAVRPGTLVLPILALAIVNLVWMGWQDVLQNRFRKAAEDEPKVIRHTLFFANAQVAIDLLLLTVILRYTGGVENPMALFYLFHMGIGALLLKWWRAVLQGCWAMLLYASLVLGEYSGVINPHWDFLPQFKCPELYTRGEYVLAALTVMACGVFATLYFTLHIKGRLHDHERKLREAFDSLKRSEAAIFDLQQRRARFLQTAAHQLKSPLASIDTLVGLLKDGIVPTQALESTYAKIRRRCEEGIQQVSELLALARVQRSDPRRHRRSVADVLQVVKEVCERFSPEAESQGLTLEFDAPKSEKLTALVDPADLADCISNLLENAIKFTPGPGTVTVCVAASNRPEKVENTALAGAPTASMSFISDDSTPADWVTVTVADSGMGIEPEVLAEARDPSIRGSIFDAFRRGNNALAAGIPGTGLGLAIVREVVEQAGGRILVRSRKGEGSSFSVILPGRETSRGQFLIRETRDSLVVIEPEAPQTRNPPSAPRHEGAAKTREAVSTRNA